MFSSVQFSFISAPPHEQNNKMLRSLCVVKDGVRKRKKQQNDIRKRKEEATKRLEKGRSNKM